jgi:hypothetical protein
MFIGIRTALFPFFALTVFCQYAVVLPAPPVQLPKIIDGNTSAVWADGELYIFHSSGIPTRSKGPDQFQLAGTERINFDSTEHKSVWFEAAWRDDDGTLFLWYHHEPSGVCKGSGLTLPSIGAAISYDNGKTVKDLGVVLESGDPADCDSKNGFFAGGHGDFSVIPDRENGFFYFFFTNYGGAPAEQGVATARMPFADRSHPGGTVKKYYQGQWEEPGQGGHMTPIYPASNSWQQSGTDSHWGPSIHWNTFLEKYVILMNHACCEPGWPQVGVYAAFNADLSDPAQWTVPWRILDIDGIAHKPGYYPQVLGLEPDGTDTLAGRVARLYVHGDSDYEIVFLKETPITSPIDPCDPESGQVCPEISIPSPRISSILK